MDEPDRLNVKLIPKSVEALSSLVRATSMNKTDLTNRAVQLYAWVIEQEQDGGELLMRYRSGDVDRVKLI